MKKKFRIALAGNPNCGKTSIFNALTGARQHVGNYPGVTVEITTTSVANCYGTPNTSSDALSQLAAGTEVTLVAQEPGAYASWYVIQDDQGDLFFVGKQFFN